MSSSIPGTWARSNKLFNVLQVKSEEVGIDGCIDLFDEYASESYQRCIHKKLYHISDHTFWSQSPSAITLFNEELSSDGLDLLLEMHALLRMRLHGS